MKANLYRWIRVHGCALTQSHPATSCAARQRLKLCVAALALGLAFLNASASTEWTAKDTVLGGVAVADTTDDIRMARNFSKDAPGAVIVEIEPDSPAAKVGLRKGDVILGIADRQSPKNAKELVAISKEFKPNETIEILVYSQTQGDRAWVALHPPAADGSSQGIWYQGNIELIIDASGSMAAKIGGRTKMDIAKQALTDLLLSIPSNKFVSVRAYGHRKKDDCNDIELISGFAEPRTGLAAKINSLKPLGKTPLSNSITAAAKDFAGTAGHDNTIILITDGEETCNADPCAAAKLAHESGVKVKINVIGFKIDPKERAQLECIANAGGGKYVSANDAAELAAATKQVAAPVISNPAPAPAATANPEDDNILAQAHGGQVLVAPNDEWTKTNDGKEEAAELLANQEAVYAFKDEQPATFDNFATLVPGASDNNLKEIELLVSDESPTGTFRSIGKFTVQNAKMLKSPYQEFKFEPVTAKYLKVKLITNYGGYKSYLAYEFKVRGKTNEKGIAEPVAKAPAKKEDNNILAASNGGQLLVAPSDEWSKMNDGKEDLADLRAEQEAVFAFKDEQPATFDRFASLVSAASDNNLKEFELLAGDESPTGTFRSIGKFTLQNAKMLKSPYQEFKFEPVTAKYLKVKLISNFGAYKSYYASEFKVLGQVNPAGASEGSTAKGSAESAPKTSGQKKAEGTNLLAASVGGQLLVAPDDDWNKTIDGKEDYVLLRPGQEAVFAFKDEKPATFDRFATLVSETADWNLKEFELLAGDESPTGTFRSIGTFTVQNAKMLKSPYQEFKFDPVTAKYLKIKLNSNYGAYQKIFVSEFKVFSSGGSD